MLNLSKTLSWVAIAVASLSLQAEDFHSLMQVVKNTWPEKTHIGVVCDYRSSQAQVEALGRAAGEGFRITVVDVRSSEKAFGGADLAARHQAQFVVIFPEDRLVRDGSMGGTIVIQRLANLGIPSVGTTARSVAQGAVFSVGDGTRGELLVSPELIGTVDVILPLGASFSRRSSLAIEGELAQVMVPMAR